MNINLYFKNKKEDVLYAEKPRPKIQKIKYDFVLTMIIKTIK